MRRVARVIATLGLVAATLIGARAAAAAPATMLDVRCTASGTSLGQDELQVGMAGAWLRVANATGEPRSVVVEIGRERAPVTRRWIGPRSRGSMRLALAPGDWRVACIDPRDPRQDPPSSPGYRGRLRPVTVVDPHGWYRTEEPDCRQVRSVVAQHVAGEQGEADVEDLPAMARARLPYVLPTDVVGDAGYALASSGRRSYRLLRGDLVIGVVRFVQLDDGWVIDAWSYCDPPPAVPGSPAPPRTPVTVPDVSCTADGTTVRPEPLQVRMGGAWLRVTNLARRRLAVMVEVGVARAPLVTRPIGPRRSGWMRIALPPGAWRVGCIDTSDPGQDPPYSDGYRSRLEPLGVIDTHGWYRSDELTCSGRQTTFADYAAGTAGELDASRLPTMARQQIAYARSTDVVGDAGYAVRRRGTRVYRLLRGPQVVGLVSYLELGRGWLFSSSTTCASPPP